MYFYYNKYTVHSQGVILYFCFCILVFEPFHNRRLPQSGFNAQHIKTPISNSWIQLLDHDCTHAHAQAHTHTHTHTCLLSALFQSISCLLLVNEITWACCALIWGKRANFTNTSIYACECVFILLLGGPPTKCTYFAISFL